MRRKREELRFSRVVECVANPGVQHGQRVEEQRFRIGANRVQIARCKRAHIVALGLFLAEQIIAGIADFKGNATCPAVLKVEISQQNRAKRRLRGILSSSPRRE